MLSRRHRYTRAHRLRGAAQFRRVYASPRRASSAAADAAAAENGGTLARLGIAIGKRNIPAVVVRNRLKRLTREQFRGQQARLGGLDVVITVRRQAAAMRKREFIAVVQKLFDRIASCEGF